MDNDQETTENNWWQSPLQQQGTGSPQDGTTEISQSLERDISALADEWIAAKKALRAAQVKVDKVATALIEKVGIKDEGSQSFYVGDYKIVTTQNINYTVDQGMAQALLENGVLNPELFQSVFLPKLGLSKTAYRETCALLPELAPDIQACLTSKAGKPGVKVELKPKED